MGIFSFYLVLIFTNFIVVSILFHFICFIPLFRMTTRHCLFLLNLFYYFLFMSFYFIPKLGPWNMLYISNSALQPFYPYPHENVSIMIVRFTIWRNTHQKFDRRLFGTSIKEYPGDPAPNPLLIQTSIRSGTTVSGKRKRRQRRSLWHGGRRNSHRCLF